MSNSKDITTTNESKMVNIISKSTKSGNIIISMEDTQYYYLPFNKSPLDLTDGKTRDQFIKSIERNARSSKLYNAYINYLKTDCNLTKCAVFGNIGSSKGDKTKIEMHHGPIFTMYDYCSIVLEKALKDGTVDNLNTFDLAAEVLDLHRRKLVQTVMLSETAHKSMDNPKLAPFISLDQTFGNLYGFVKEYGKYFSPTHRVNLKNYFTKYNENMKENQLNMFKPIFTQYNIKFTKNKLEIQE